MTINKFSNLNTKKYKNKSKFRLREYFEEIFLYFISKLYVIILK